LIRHQPGPLISQLFTEFDVPAGGLDDPGQHQLPEHLVAARRVV
jgi:hypothetical protein